MPADVQLARREGIELIHTGSWSALSGSWKPTRDDILAAVEAQQCPAVRRPRLKLGHTDTRFNGGGDGTPALGWIENLRAADDGHTLIGDQVALPWLSQVQAAAYPDRSIEGNYRHVCALGHTHPFVVTAVALLGVTPPAVSTLRSVQDLPALLGVAASEEIPEGAQQVQVTVRAGRHSFDESKHHRDGDGQFARTASAGGGVPLKDALKLGGRITLGPGESLAGSAELKEPGIALAAVDGPDGRRVRIGIGLDPDDIRKWRAANKGATADLDESGVAEFRAGIARMLDIAGQAKEHSKGFERRDRELQARERELVNAQYPNLTKTQAKELDRIDRQIADSSQQIASFESRRQQRIGYLPDPEDRRKAADLEAAINAARTSGDTATVQDLQLQQRAVMWGFSPAEMRERDRLEAARFTAALTAGQQRRFGELRQPRSGIEFETAAQFFGNDVAREEAEHQVLQAATRRRAELTAVSRPLSDDDEKALVEVRAAIRVNDDEWFAFEDDSFLTDGVIASPWGDVVYETTWTGSPRFKIGVRPSGAGPDWQISTDSADWIDAAMLRKLDSLLGRATTKGAVAASAEVHTGAMVALIPTADDAARLTVDGGEPANQLHVTLRYLGKADQIPDRARARIVEAVARSVASLPAFDADAFSVAAFNPDSTDRDPCVVLGMSGDLIEAAHDQATLAVAEVAADMVLDLPAPHRPFHAHLTLGYTEDLGKVVEWSDRTGPVRFDRVRVVFGGTRTDIPLTAADSAEVLARFDPGQRRDGAGKWTDGSPGPSRAGLARKVRIRGEDGPIYAETDTDGGLSLRMPFDGSDDYDPDDPDTARLQQSDTIRLTPDATAEFTEDLDLLAQDRDAYVKKAKPLWKRMDDTEGTDAYQAAEDAWGKLGEDGDRIAGGELDGDTGTLVYEWRRGHEPDDNVFLMAIRPKDVDPDEWDLNDAASDLAGAFLGSGAFKKLRKHLGGDVAASAELTPDVPDPVLPAAEPELSTPEPKEEDPVSDTDLSGFRSRLGLTDDATQDQILEALDALKAKADTPPAPTPEMVAASAAATEQAAKAEAEKDELRKEVTVLASQMGQVTAELAAVKAEKAATVKASVLDAAVKEGRIKPADREQWESDYDEAPAAITRVLASIAVGTAVPVAASGTAGTPEPVGTSFDDAEYARLFGTTQEV